MSDPSPRRRRRPASTGASGSHALIRAVVRQIPAGRVATYGQVAALAGFPGHARLVGYALASLPAHSTVPWHRVINAQGRLSLERDPGGTGIRQRQRLEAEGVCFLGRRVPLDRYQWKPRGVRRPE